MQPDYKPLTCPHCRCQLALATPTKLLFNAGSCCDKPVTLRCTTCGAERFWKPQPALDSCAILQVAPA